MRTKMTRKSGTHPLFHGHAKECEYSKIPSSNSELRIRMKTTENDDVDDNAEQ